MLPVNQLSEDLQKKQLSLIFFVLDLLLDMRLGLGDGSGKVEDCCFLAFAVWSAEVPPNFVFLEEDGVSHRGLLLHGTGAVYIYS